MNGGFVPMSKYVRPQNYCCVPKKPAKKRIIEEKYEPPVTSLEKLGSFPSIRSEKEVSEDSKSISFTDADKQRPLIVVVLVNGRNKSAAGHRSNENGESMKCMCKDEIQSCDCSLQEEDIQGENNTNTYDYTEVNRKSVNGNRPPDFTENFRRLEELICKCAKTEPNSARNFKTNQLKRKPNANSRSSSRGSSQSQSSESGNPRRICKAYSQDKLSRTMEKNKYKTNKGALNEENEDINYMESLMADGRGVRNSFNGNTYQKENCNGMAKISCPICAAAGFQRVEVPICVAKEGCPHCRRIEMETATTAVAEAITNIKTNNKNESNDCVCPRKNNEQVCYINGKCLDYCQCMNKSTPKNSKKKKKSTQKKKNNGLVDRFAPISHPLRDMPKKVVKSKYSKNGLHRRKEKPERPPVILRDLPKKFVQSEQKSPFQQECPMSQNCVYYMPPCNGCCRGCQPMW